MFDGHLNKDLVAMAWWTHLFPYRTQKLSIITATIVGNCNNSKLPVRRISIWISFFYAFSLLFMGAGCDGWSLSLVRPWWILFSCLPIRDSHIMWIIMIVIGIRLLMGIWLHKMILNFRKEGWRFWIFYKKKRIMKTSQRWNEFRLYICESDFWMQEK